MLKKAYNTVTISTVSPGDPGDIKQYGRAKGKPLPDDVDIHEDNQRDKTDKRSDEIIGEEEAERGMRIMASDYRGKASHGRVMPPEFAAGGAPLVENGNTN